MGAAVAVNVEQSSSSNVWTFISDQCMKEYFKIYYIFVIYTIHVTKYWALNCPQRISHHHLDGTLDDGASHEWMITCNWIILTSIYLGFQMQN